MVLDIFLLNTKQYKVRIEGKVDALFLLFNGISTFVGYLMPKLFS